MPSTVSGGTEGRVPLVRRGMTLPPQDAGTGPQDARPEEFEPPPSLRCPVCGHTEFQDEEMIEMSRWQMRQFRFTVLICRQCRFALHFLAADQLGR